MLRPISSTSSVMASEVDRPGLKPNWLLVRRSCLSRQVIRSCCTNFSRIFPGRGRSDIGLRLETFVGLETLGIGITVTFFQSFSESRLKGG